MTENNPPSPGGEQPAGSTPAQRAQVLQMIQDLAQALRNANAASSSASSESNYGNMTAHEQVKHLLEESKPADGSPIKYTCAVHEFSAVDLTLLTAAYVARLDSALCLNRNGTRYVLGVLHNDFGTEVRLHSPDGPQAPEAMTVPPATEHRDAPYPVRMVEIKGFPQLLLAAAFGLQGITARLSQALEDRAEEEEDE